MSYKSIIKIFYGGYIMVIIKNSIKLLLAFSFVASFVSSPLSAVSHRVLRNDSRPEAEIERERQNQNLKIAKTQGRHARQLKKLSKTVDTISKEKRVIVTEQKTLVHRQNLSTKKFHKIIVVSGVVVGIFAVGACIFWKVLNGHADQLLGHGVRHDEKGETIVDQSLNLLEQWREIKRIGDSLVSAAHATSETLKQIPNVVTEQTIQTITESRL
jgi:hypothetical protein